MKIDMLGGQVVDVVFNPGRKTDGRPNAGLEYTAALRASSDGTVRLTLSTDFTPPCLLVELTEMAGAESADLLRRLGMAVPDDGWTQVRATYAFIDGVRYAPPTDEELEFMAAFGFVPGARFDLALPMLRAQRAQLGSDGVVAAPERPEVVAVVVQDPAPVQPEDIVDVIGVSTTVMPAQNVETGERESKPPAKRQRRSAKPAGKVEIVSQVLGEPTEEPIVPAAVADVFDVLDAAPTPSGGSIAKTAGNTPVTAVESNPFMIEEL